MTESAKSAKKRQDRGIRITPTLRWEPKIHSERESLQINISHAQTLKDADSVLSHMLNRNQAMASFDSEVRQFENVSLESDQTFFR